MTSGAWVQAGPPRRDWLVEGRKLPAFLRRDLLIALSYRMGFFSDLISLVAQAVVFAFVSLMIDPSKMPTLGGTRVSYMGFVAVGIAVSTFLQVGTGRMVVAFRNEQLMGTLESLFITPTSAMTLQLGSVMYVLIYVPVRTALFLAMVATFFGVDFNLNGFAPAALLLVAFVPFIWGLGAANAAAVLAFKRVSGLIGLGTAMLSVASGAYFPLALLPDWLEAIAWLNPIALVLQGVRELLLGHGGWATLWPHLSVIAPLGLVSLAAGSLAFRLAVRRERRLGTLGLY